MKLFILLLVFMACGVPAQENKRSSRLKYLYTEYVYPRPNTSIYFYCDTGSKREIYLFKDSITLTGNACD